jgi:hypothetical protein
MCRHLNISSYLLSIDAQVTKTKNAISLRLPSSLQRVYVIQTNIQRRLTSSCLLFRWIMTGAATLPDTAQPMGRV